MPVNSFENYPMSWKPRKEQLTQPYYLSLAALLEYDIQSGRLPPHTKLPPQRELADWLDLNLSTITRAYKRCEMKGLTYATTGRGTFVAPQPEATAPEKPYIELGSIYPFDGCNRAVVEGAKYVLSKGYAEKLLDYGDPLGTPSQRVTARDWLRRLGVEATPEHIAVTSGAQNALVIALLTLFQPGDAIAADRYTLPGFVELAHMLHLTVVPVEADESGMRPDALEAACARQRIRGVYLMPTCQMPTTVMMDQERRAALARLAGERDLLILEDDIYAFLAPEGVQPTAALAPEHTVHICSLSKSLSAGLRVAFLAYPARWADAMVRGIYNVNVKTPAFNTEVACTLIRSGVAEEIVQEKIRLAEERNAIFDRWFPRRAGGNEHPLSFCRWLPLEGRRGLAIEQEALANGVRVFHSDRFLAGPPEGREFLRVALSSPADSVQLEKGLSLLKQVIDRRPAPTVSSPVI